MDDITSWINFHGKRMEKKMLKNYIEQGAKKAGSLTALGKLLDISQPDISNAKAERKGITLEACIKLADYIGTDRLQVIAANQLVTERKEQKREFWLNLFEHARAAVIMLFALVAVTTFVTPSPAEANQAIKHDKQQYILCKIMKRGLISFVGFSQKMDGYPH